jgi:hypothetical protein
MVIAILYFCSLLWRSTLTVVIYRYSAMGQGQAMSLLMRAYYRSGKTTRCVATIQWGIDNQLK